MKLNPLEQKLTSLFAPVLQDNGLRLVCVKVLGTEKAQTVQIMAENPETRRLGVDDCALVSREISALMDVEDPIKGAYRLEVSSPGIDRVLVTAQDFIDYAGFEAKVEIFPALNGQKRFRGRLRGMSDDGQDVLLTTEDQGDIAFPLATLEKAKLVLTDDLIAATTPQAAQGADPDDLTDDDLNTTDDE